MPFESIKFNKVSDNTTISSFLRCINVSLNIPEFLSIYESEDKVDLYTNELLFQNIYYIIERLVSHKKYIIESFSKLECEVETKLNNDIKQFKSSRNAFLDKIKIKFINSFYKLFI